MSRIRCLSVFVYALMCLCMSVRWEVSEARLVKQLMSVQRHLELR